MIYVFAVTYTSLRYFIYHCTLETEEFVAYERADSSYKARIAEESYSRCIRH